jgi:hypothetical protein
MRRANRRLLAALMATVAETQGTSRFTGGSADIYTIVPADLDAADDAVQRCEMEWTQAGAVCVTDEQLDQAQRGAEELQQQFDHAKRQGRRSLTLIYLHAVRLFVLSGLPALGKTAVIGGGAVIICLLSLIIPLLFFLLVGPLGATFGATLLGAAVITVCGSALLATPVLILWPTEAKRQAFHRHYQQWRERRAAIERIGPAVEHAWASFRDLRGHWKLQRRLEKARQRRAEVATLLASAKYQLIHTDWRSLRDADFERFVARVFETLGYDVELTKASGDQGVDLVVKGKGRRLAIQAKGYSGSVGNHAVMEVVAGMAYYQCDTCAVVTNSCFTSTAEKLAMVNGCGLVGAAQILDLIEGRIY